MRTYGLPPGAQVLRRGVPRGHERDADVEWVAINDVAEPAMLAHLLRNDSVYGRFAGEVEVEVGARIATPSETDPAKLPWGELDADVVIESTGRFRAREDAAKQLGIPRTSRIRKKAAALRHERTAAAPRLLVTVGTMSGDALALPA